MEVLPGIHRLESSLGDRYVCLHLLRGSDRSVLVDTGIASSTTDVLLPYLERSGIDPSEIDYVISSHADFDHVGGNASVRAAIPTATFACHRLDRELIESLDLLLERRYGEFAQEHGIADSDDTVQYIRASTEPTDIDLTLSGGERIRLQTGSDVEILHTPGHSRGHMTVFEPRTRAAVVSDAVLGTTLYTRGGAPAFPPTYRYLDSYLASISQLELLQPSVLLTGHFPVYQDEAVAEFLAESRAFTQRLDAALGRELASRNSPVPTRELIESVAPQVGDWTDAGALLLVYPLLGHLERLADYRRVERGSQNGLATWRWRE